MSKNLKYIRYLRLSVHFRSVGLQTPYFCQAKNYLAMLHLACAFIISRKLAVVRYGQKVADEGERRHSRAR